MLVHGDVDLKEAFGGVAKWRTEDGVGEGGVAEACEAFGDDAGGAFGVGVDDFPALGREITGLACGDDVG